MRVMPSAGLVRINLLATVFNVERIVKVHSLQGLLGKEST